MNHVKPDFVDNELAEKAFELVKSKKNSPKLLKDAKFEEIEDGLCIQMLHIGSYDDEFNTTYKEMEKFIEENSYKRKSHNHREIYLKFSDNKDELRTVIRFFINQ